MAKAYRPGDWVPAAGIYRIQHGSGHRLVHHATIQAGIRFPRCRACREQVRFTLVREVRTLVIIPFRSNTILEEYRCQCPVPAGA